MASRLVISEKIVAYISGSVQPVWMHSTPKNGSLCPSVFLSLSLFLSLYNIRLSLSISRAGTNGAIDVVGVKIRKGFDPLFFLFNRQQRQQVYMALQSIV